VAGGDLGVDVVAPPRPWIADGRPGTSAAAARVAGVAALLRAADPELEPSAVTRTLRASAADVGRAGPDVVSGHGRLAPLAAVQRVRAR
jgi:subtilisin family serine protease